METPPRQLTETRIRELLDGMPAFNKRIRKLGRTKHGRAPLPLPAPEDYPAVGSPADFVAESFSDDPAEIAFYRDVMRMQELWAFGKTRHRSARATIDAAIDSLRQQTQLTIATPDADAIELPLDDMPEIFATMISARIADLESITDEELDAVARFAPEIEKVMLRGVRR